MGQFKDHLAYHSLIMNKIFGILLCFSFLFSCEDKKASAGEATKPSNDSNAIVKPEVASNPYSPIDVSPMDMSYYPVDYPKLKMTNSINTPPVMRIIYS